MFLPISSISSCKIDLKLAGSEPGYWKPARMVLGSDDMEGWVISVLDSNGTPFNEHEVEYLKPANNNRTTQCWLESRSNETFSIKVDPPRNLQGKGYSCIVKVDGRELCRSNISESRAWIVKTVHHDRDGTLYRSTLKFDSLETTDEDHLAQNKENILNGLGTIEVELISGTVRKEARKRGKGGQSRKPEAMEGVGKVHEKRKKAFADSCVGFGEGQPWQARPRGDWKYIFEPSKPCKRRFFKFKYRSEDFLRAKDIITDPPHVPLADRLTSDLKPKEERKPTQTSEEHDQQVKRERIDSEEEDGEEEGGIQYLSQQHKLEAGKFMAGEVIDLTGDFVAGEKYILMLDD